jgi:arylsulfatase A-like enzyme
MRISPRIRTAIACLLASLAAACDSAPRLQNVLLISVDSLRADRLGAYGNERPTTPTLDRLAREGVLFERAYSPTSWTLPSHATLLTGRDLLGHATMFQRDAIPAETLLLQEQFARAGFEVFGIFSGPFLHPHFGFGRGSRSYVSCQSDPGGESKEERRRAHWASHVDRTNPCIESTFARWVAERPQKPFFAFVHMWDVHFDYTPPEPYAEMFDTGYAGPLDGSKIVDAGFPLDAGASELRHLLALYDGEVRYTDETIGTMLEALDRAGALDRTLVVVTADHGEEFLEHGGKTHRRTVHVESVHVPLVFWAASGLARGHRVETAVSLADVAPTIDALFGIAPPAGIEGRSLVPALRGEPLPSRPVRSAHASQRPSGPRTIALRSEGRSLIHSKPDEWVAYDLASDPAEQRPIALAAGADRAALEAFDAELQAFLEQRREARKAEVAAGKKRRGPPSDVKQRLRELGYVE